MRETCRELIPAGSVSSFLAEHRGCAVSGGDARGYASLARWAAEPAAAGAGGGGGGAAALPDLPDFEAVQALRCDLRWKAACGLGLLDGASDSSLLTYFRRRLARSDDPNRVFARVGQADNAVREPIR